MGGGREPEKGEAAISEVRGRLRIGDLKSKPRKYLKKEGVSRLCPVPL